MLAALDCCPCCGRAVLFVSPACRVCVRGFFKRWSSVLKGEEGARINAHYYWCQLAARQRQTTRTKESCAFLDMKGVGGCG